MKPTDLGKAGFQQMTMTDTWALIPFSITSCAAEQCDERDVLARADECLRMLLGQVRRRRIELGGEEFDPPRAATAPNLCERRTVAELGAAIDRLRSARQPGAPAAIEDPVMMACQAKGCGKSAVYSLDWLAAGNKPSCPCGGALKPHPDNGGTK